MGTAKTLIRDVGILFQTLTLHQLSLDEAIIAWAAFKAGTGPSVSNPYEQVRLAWQRGGAPAWGVVDDVVILRATVTDTPYHLPDTVYTEHVDPSNEYLLDQKTVRAAALSVYYSFYGPNSFDNALWIRDTIKYQENHDILARALIYIIPRAFPARRIPEEWQGQWYERTDLEMLFNWTVSRTAVINAVETVNAYIRPEAATEETLVIV
jgi:hypothetical protein